MTARRSAGLGLPLGALALGLAAWEGAVRLRGIPPYVLPSPSRIAATLVADWPILSRAFLVTLRISLEALALATAASLGLALLFARFPVLGRGLFPFATLAQVTPVVAVAPLLLIYLEPPSAVLACAFLVSFFPVLSNTVRGLAAPDRDLLDLLETYGATPWQQIAALRLPTALPFVAAGLRIGGGLAVVGALVAELAAGSGGGGSGLAFRLSEAGFRLNIPRMYAALALIALLGLVISAACDLLAGAVLRRWPNRSA